MINISRALAAQGWMNEDELIWLAETAQTKQRIVEVGSWKGRSTLALLANTLGLVWAVDHWQGSVNDPALEKELKARGSDAIFDEFCENTRDYLGRLLILKCPAKAAARRFLIEGRVFDFVFIDGDHNYESVKADIENYSKLLVPGGLLAGHDYGHNGVCRAVTERFTGIRCPAGQIWAVNL